MSSVADLEAMRDEFAAAFEAGDSPDPSDWLARVSAPERQKLELLIDSYLMTASRRAWDADAYQGSLAKLAVERVFESREGVSGSWPELLPRLRDRARVKRADLVRRLADALGVGGDPADLDKVGWYYNRMEHGALPAAGVSETVLDALAGLVGSSVQALRAAGERAGGTGGGEAVAYARVASPDPARFELADADADMSVPASAAEPPPERDRIDELFTGG